LEVALHENVAVCVGLTLAELDISPLEAKQLALPQASPHCAKEERVVLRIELPGSFEKSLALFWRQSCGLSGFEMDAIESSNAEGRVSLNELVLDSMIQNGPQGASA
jgi:hypothetical protein